MMSCDIVDTAPEFNFPSEEIFHGKNLSLSLKVHVRGIRTGKNDLIPSLQEVLWIPSQNYGHFLLECKVFSEV